jgi:hypothetical protein
LKAELAAVKQRLETVEKRLIDGPMPDWFATEFGQDALNGVIDTPSGDYDFWRNLAVQLRLKRK